MSPLWQTLTAPGIQVEAAPIPAAYLAFVAVALGFAGMGLATSALLRRRRKAGAASVGSTTAYEGGEEPIGTPWVAFHARYYAIALVFLLFEVEIAFMFPYALAFAGTSPMLALAEGFLFVGVLGLGLAFAWRAGLLDWPSGKKVGENEGWQGPVPEGAYQDIYKKAL